MQKTGLILAGMFVLIGIGTVLMTEEANGKPKAGIDKKVKLIALLFAFAAMVVILAAAVPIPTLHAQKFDNTVYAIGNKTAFARLHKIPDIVTTGVEHAYDHAQILYGPTSNKTQAAFSDKTVVECINDLFETRFSILNSTIEICDSAISQDLSLPSIDDSVQISLGSGQYTTLNFQNLAKLYLQARNIL